MEIGIIGAGWWAAQAYIPLLLSDRRITACAVCRPDPEGLESIRREFGIRHLFTDAREMLLRRPLAGVIVASPHHLHAEHAAMCLARHVPVLVEKPMATSASDARRLAAMASETGTPLMVALGWNFRSICLAAQTLIQAGWIGELRHATCLTATATLDLFSGRPHPPTRDHLFQPAPSTWADPKTAGGYAWGQLIHALGVFFLLVDIPPARVFARFGVSETGVDLTEAAVAELANGATVAVSGSALLPRGRRKHLEIRLFGDRGEMLLDLEHDRLEVAARDGRLHQEPLEIGSGEYRVDEMVESFVRLCAGDDIPNHADGVIGLRGVEIIDAMHRSARSGLFEAV